MAAAAVEADKAYLKSSKVTDHVEKIIRRVTAERPKDAYGLVEVISRLVKEPAEEPVAFVKEDQEERAKYSGQIKELLKVPREDPANPESGITAVCPMPDLVEEAEMLGWAGSGFGDVESYKIMCSMRGLCVKEKAAGAPEYTKMRFWGKIFGTEADYYVVEATLPEGPGEVPEDEPDMEPDAVGVNQWAYYVTSDLCAEWRKLPAVKPREIVAARKIKRLMTGRLESKVITHPYFPGTEAVLLRAQIALVASESVLCIKGFLVLKEPDADPPGADGEPVLVPAEVEPNGEFGTPDGTKVPTTAELLLQASWTHMQPEILCNGRTTHLELEEVPDDPEDPEHELKKAKNKQLEADREQSPIRQVMRGLEADALGWVIKQAGDLSLYADPKAPGAPASNAVTLLRSLRWPGAVVAARGKQFTNLYVGYGLPAGQPDFFPCAPKDVEDEPEDAPENDEPQGASADDAVPADGDP